MIKEMLVYRQAANESHCSIKVWRIPRSRASEFAARLAAETGTNAKMILNALTMGGLHLLGAQVCLVGLKDG